MKFSFAILCFLLLAHPATAQVASKTAPQEKTTSNSEYYTKDDRFPDGLVHVFGKVATGTLCKHTFRIVNTSDSPIEISVRLSAGARCLMAKVSKTRLQAKEAGKLDLIVDTSMFIGMKTMTIYLTARGKTFEETGFWIQCNSDRDLKLDPKIALQIRLVEAARRDVGKERDKSYIASVLKEGAQVNGPDQWGKTALMYAASEGLVENVKTLLANGADPTVKTADGSTALSFAEPDYGYRIEGRRAVAKLLREHHAKKR
jgi:hypothetical protein